MGESRRRTATPRDLRLPRQSSTLPLCPHCAAPPPSLLENACGAITTGFLSKGTGGGYPPTHRKRNRGGFFRRKAPTNVDILARRQSEARARCLKADALTSALRLSVRLFESRDLGIQNLPSTPDQHPVHSTFVRVGTSFDTRRSKSTYRHNSRSCAGRRIEV
jgi:hypothetical protein